ncbi:Hypothetical predicted protein, partial [Olea europaea subsp. europaea]
SRARPLQAADRSSRVAAGKGTRLGEARAWPALAPAPPSQQVRWPTTRQARERRGPVISLRRLICTCRQVGSSRREPVVAKESPLRENSFASIRAELGPRDRK